MFCLLGSARTMPKQLLAYEPAEDPETLDWWSLTPGQRFLESQKLWTTFVALGGSLDPEPDWQSPFYFAEISRPRPAHGGGKPAFSTAPPSSAATSTWRSWQAMKTSTACARRLQNYGRK